MSARVIVFGPTGKVGSFAARTAQKQGAKVFLAMRNVQKPIPGLSPEQERKGGFERIQADLTQPESIVSAVKKSKTTTAFMYLAHQSPDHMRATIEASKSAGITFIVFLSSFTIKGDLEKIKSTDRIPYIHARVEMNLEEIYGKKNYVALRPGAFASNTLWWRAGMRSGEMELTSPNTRFDYITFKDMGTVAGIVCAEGQRDGQHIVYLYGPELVPQKDAIVIAAKAMGKEVVTDGSPGKDRILVRFGPEETRGDWFQSAYSNFEEGVSNVFKYTGKPPMGYKEWAEENKMLFDEP